MLESKNRITSSIDQPKDDVKSFMAELRGRIKISSRVTVTEAREVLGMSYYKLQALINENDLMPIGKDSEQRDQYSLATLKRLKEEADRPKAKSYSTKEIANEIYPNCPELFVCRVRSLISDMKLNQHAIEGNRIGPIGMQFTEQNAQLIADTLREHLKDSRKYAKHIQ